jgi:hypothetical protein
LSLSFPSHKMGTILTFHLIKPAWRKRLVPVLCCINTGESSIWEGTLQTERKG